MDVGMTLAVVGLATLTAVVCGWLGARPSDPSRPPRLAPWRLMMLLAFAVAVMALGHLAAIWRGS